MADNSFRGACCFLGAVHGNQEERELMAGFQPPCQERVCVFVGGLWTSKHRQNGVNGVVETVQALPQLGHPCLRAWGKPLHFPKPSFAYL